MGLGTLEVGSPTVKLIPIIEDLFFSIEVGSWVSIVKRRAKNETGNALFHFNERLRSKHQCLLLYVSSVTSPVWFIILA